MSSSLYLQRQASNMRGSIQSLQTQIRPIVEKPVSAGFPWGSVLFGYSIAGNVFTVKAGEIHFRDKIYSCSESALTIASNLTYVYVEMEWGTGICSIKQTTTIADATASSSCFRKWLYLLNYTAPSSVSVKTYGHTGGAISIMPVFG
jgi:hypothetical protein